MVTTVKIAKFDRDIQKDIERATKNASRMNKLVDKTRAEYLDHAWQAGASHEDEWASYFGVIADCYR